MLLLAGLYGSAQKSAPKKDNLLFMVRQYEHIVQSLKTIEYLNTCPETSLQMKEAVIIVCGEAVKNLTEKDSDMLIEQIRQMPNVSLYACGLSLGKFNLSQKDLLPGVKYTQNGFIKAFELQKAGYLSVEL